MKLLLARIFLIAIGLTILNISIMSQKNTTKNKQEAERIWDLAVDAKGGREQINKVQNILITTTYSDEKYGLVELYELPDRWWRFANDPQPLGKQVVMNNLEANLYYLSDENEPSSFVKMSKAGNVELTRVQLYFLLETKFVKPLPFDATIENSKERNVYVVKTMFEGEQINFYFDVKTYTLMKVAHVGDNDKPYRIIKFSDYISLNNIQIPTRVSYKSDYKSLTNIKFNVDYNKTLFEIPPTVAAGPDAWKPKIKF